MKTKIIIAGLVMLLSYPVFSQNMRDNTENWTKTPVTRGAPGGVEGNGGGEEGTTPDAPTPVGETTWALILGLGSVYGLYVFNKKRKEVN